MAAETSLSPEDALRESEYRYRNLFQAMAASFWELDFSGVGAILRQVRDGGVKDFAEHFAANPGIVRAMMRATRILDVNDQTVALFGAGGGKAAVVAATLDAFWPEESNHVYGASVVAAVSRKASFATECKLRALDGRLVDALFTACFAPEALAAGRLLIGVIDISERVKAQEMLQRVQAEFAHAARISMLGELTASIAHEVNQPLAAIATNASAGLRWLDRAEPDLAEVRALTQRIIADAERAADIIARVRAMAGHQTTERVLLSVNGLIEEAMVFLRHELQAHEVETILDLAAGLPPVFADRVQIQQVVVNLAVNAMQSMASGGEPRHLHVRSRSEGGDVSISVEDNGPGLDEAQLARLFESFFTTKSGGMGMGLPICRSIIEAHGGTISARNRKDGGASFLVTLKAASQGPIRAYEGVSHV
jgi:signal transduction histidine kinase